jgi:hypothetical protein
MILTPQHMDAAVLLPHGRTFSVESISDTVLVLAVQAVVDLWDKVLDGYSDLAVVSGTLTAHNCLLLCNPPANLHLCNSQSQPVAGPN